MQKQRIKDEIREAKRLYSNAEYEKAKEILLNLYPQYKTKNSDITFYLGITQWYLNNTEQSEQYLKEHMTYFPQDFRSRSFLARKYNQLNKIPEAKRQLVTIIKKDKNNEEAKQYLISIYRRQLRETTNSKTKMEIYKNWLTYIPDSKEAKKELNELYSKEKQKQKGKGLIELRKTCEYWFQDIPDSDEAKANLVVIYRESFLTFVKKTQWSEAEQYYKSYIQLETQKETIRRKNAEDIMQIVYANILPLEELQEQEENVLKVLKEDNYNPYYRIALARIYQRLGKEENAKKLFMSCNLVHSSQTILMEKEEKQSAIFFESSSKMEGYFNRAIEMDSSNPYLLFKLIELKLQQEKELKISSPLKTDSRKEEIIKLVQQYIAIKHEDSDMILQLQQMLLEGGFCEQCKLVISAGQQLFSKDEKIQKKLSNLNLIYAKQFNKRGEEFLHQKRYQEAKKMIQNSLVFEKSSSSISLLIELYSQQDEQEELLNVLNVYRSYNPEIELELGRFYARYLEKAQAEEILLKYANNEEKSKSKSYIKDFANMELKNMYVNIQRNCKLNGQYTKFLRQMGTVSKFMKTVEHTDRHLKNDISKSLQGVFRKGTNLVQLVEKVKKSLDPKEKRVVNEYDLYCIEMLGIGYLGGINGDGHILNYVTVLTLPDSPNDIITIYPSDNIRKVRKGKIMRYGTYFSKEDEPIL